MELTKEYFDKQIALTKEHLDTQLNIVKSDMAEHYTELKGDIRLLQADMSEVKKTVKEHNRRSLDDSNAFANLVQHDRRLSNLERLAGLTKLQQRAG